MSLALGSHSGKRARWVALPLALAIIAAGGPAAQAGSSVIALPPSPIVTEGKTPPRATKIVIDSRARIWVFASTSTRVVVLTQRGRASSTTIPGPGLVSHAVAVPHGGVCYSEVEIGETQATGSPLRYVACFDAGWRTKTIDVPQGFAGVDDIAAGPRVDLALLDVSGQRVARIIHGKTSEYRLSGKNVVLGGLAVAMDGSVWFNESTPLGGGSNVVERIALGGTVKKVTLPGYSASRILPSGRDGVILLTGAQVGSMLVKARMVSGSPSIDWRKHVPDAGSIATTSDGSTWLVDQESGLVLYRLNARGDMTRVRRPDGAGSPITALTAHGLDVWYATLANDLVHLSATVRTRR